MKKSILPKVPAAFALFALCSFHAPADTIKLKDGKSIDGTIIAEDASSVTIKTIVVGKITDNKVVPRSEIASFVKKTPEDDAAEAVKKILPTEDFLLPSAYNKIIAEGPDKFLATYPNSKYRAEIVALKKSLTDEQAQSRRGMRKVDGKWLSGEEMQANEYNIQTLKVFREMEKAVAAEDFRAALDAFTRIEAMGRFSLSYPKAIELARTVLATYDGNLKAAIKAVPQKVKEAETRLANMTPSDRDAAKAEREKIKKDFVAKIAEEKKAKVRFNSILDTDAGSLNEAARQVDAEMKRLAALNVPALTERSAGYDRVLKLIGQKKYEEAIVRLDEFAKVTKDASNDPAIKKQQESLKRLREESIRAGQQQDLLKRTQPKAEGAPAAPTKEGAPAAPAAPAK